MNTLTALVKRNTKLFFKDKGMFFTSLITPLILLVLFLTFLGDVYRESLRAAVPAGAANAETLIEGMVGGWIFSSLLAVCCVTVAFCSNLLSVQDKATGARMDLTMSPVKKTTLAMSYYLSTLFSTLLICGVALAVCFLYLANRGWYLSRADVGFICLDVVILVMFGTALSSVINYFLSTQGQISAVSGIISAGYGFLCGAYIPISTLSSGVQKVIFFFPGTYGTSLLHNHLLRGPLQELQDAGVSSQVIDAIRTSFDSNIYWGDHLVTLPQMYLVICVAVAVLLVLYVIISHGKKRKRTV